MISTACTNALWMRKHLCTYTSIYRSNLTLKENHLFQGAVAGPLTSQQFFEQIFTDRTFPFIYCLYRYSFETRLYVGEVL